MPDQINNIEDKLIAYLRNKLQNSMIGYEEPLAPLEGGCETYMYRFKLKGAPKELSIPLVLRLFPQSYGTKNAVLEKTVQNVLAKEGFPVAHTYFLCTDITILGGSFLIMAFLNGNLMLTAPFEIIPGMLANAHASLHKLKPDLLINSLHGQGITDFRFSHNLDWLGDKANKHTWLQPGIEWLRENRPDDEEDNLVICHGDFHYLNILISKEEVLGIIDWSCFLIANPVLDIANSIVIITMVSKHLLPSAIKSLSSVNWEIFAQKYLNEYQKNNPLLNVKYLSYYMARRCFEAIIQGIEGQSALQHPLIIKDMIKYIDNATGIHIRFQGE
jgi:aminoglycoside phosphotransferase (APT) family kinase protein